MCISKPQKPAIVEKTFKKQFNTIAPSPLFFVIIRFFCKSVVCTRQVPGDNLPAGHGNKLLRRIVKIQHLLACVLRVGDNVFIK